MITVILMLHDTILGKCLVCQDSVLLCSVPIQQPAGFEACPGKTRTEQDTVVNHDLKHSSDDLENLKRHPGQVRITLDIMIPV